MDKESMRVSDRIRALFSSSPEKPIFAVPRSEGLAILAGSMPREEDHWVVKSPLALHALDELCASGLASEEGDGFILGWSNFYRVLCDERLAGTVSALNVPPVGRLRPRLRSSNTLEDLDFEIAVDGWMDSARQCDATRMGAIASVGENRQVLPLSSYRLLNAIADFWSIERRTPQSNREHWGKIRTLALEASAGMDQFLASTIVLSPERLQIRLANANVADTGVVEVQPWFVGAPEDWLHHFDQNTNVRDVYRIVTDQGLVEILVSPKVKTVLRAIKSMPGRRTAGAAAERFLHNPFATLGPDAVDVIDENQFDAARHEAGIEFERFVSKITVEQGTVTQVGIIVERLGENEGSSTYERFKDPSDLKAFIARIQSRLETGAQLCEWRRHQLELTGDVAAELEILKVSLQEWLKPKVVIKTLDVFDLKRYSDRISGIGIQPKIVSPYIPVQSGEDPWFPEPPINPSSAVSVSVPIDGDRELELVVDKRVYETLQAAVTEAEANGKTTISIPGHENALPLATAKATLEQLDPQFRSREPSASAGRKTATPRQTGLSKARQELLLRSNIDQSEFAEERANELRLDAARLHKAPACLRDGITLLEHQEKGVAWLQNLHEKAPLQCRGALLADDMGLGKTLQLLSLICRAFEDNPDQDPVLVVAPVSLLENWKEELEKFFREGRLHVLTLYGASLEALRAPRETIEAELVEKGIAKFLKPDWIGNAQLVLTTYETLRDLEFSLAAVHWSIMVCDEAQKIKNPAAMVTRAAKKQNVKFRIACTGTPVENSLADLWCLFDFIQPGLLGALNEFGSTYRRPIECETEAQHRLVEQLRALIEPQILRRTKSEVAKDLPPKIISEEARKLKLSNHQRALYGEALEVFKLRHDSSVNSPFKNHLGLLQYLRRLCIAPEPNGGGAEGEALKSYRRKNPKMDWLITTLSQVRSNGEKAIVFCEFRDVQLLIAHYVEAEFGMRPDIINGDTEVSVTSANSRQKRIKRFQEAPGFGVIILSPLAVGFGVNIQAANHVIHFSRTWNPAKEDQATDRAYRIGQKKPVYVYYPVVCADDFTTFDVKLDLLLEKKRALSGDMLNGCGDLSPDDFSEVVKGSDDPIFDARINIRHASKLSPIEFEALIAALWKKRGFRSVSLTPRTGDGGVDVVAKTINEGELIQCKSTGTEDARLSWEAIKDVVTGEAKYRQEHPGVSFCKVAVTNQWFNETAQRHAELNNVRLVDKAVLGQMLEETILLQSDIDAFIAARMHIRVH